MNPSSALVALGIVMANGVSADSLAKNQMFSPIVELRQYTLKPGRRDDLVHLFETRFIEGQERYGSSIIGHFRDRQNPDRFVWLRGFSSMEDRLKALEGFYFGPVWKEHRSEANDTMLDSDNVLLFRPAWPGSEFHLDPANRAGQEGPERPAGLICATLYYFSQPVDSVFAAHFQNELAPVLQQASATLLAEFVTEPSKNNFARLPVREGENIFFWLASFPDEAAYHRYQSNLAGDSRWTANLLPQLNRQVIKTETLELTPCRRSLLRHR